MTLLWLNDMTYQNADTTFQDEAQVYSPNVNNRHRFDGSEKFDDGQTSGSESASISPENSECESPIELEDEGWEAHAAARRAAAATGLPFRFRIRSSYHSDYSGITAIDTDADLSECPCRSTSTLLDATAFDPEPKDTDDSDFSVEDDLDESSDHIKFTDVFETVDCTITRTVIRPAFQAAGRRLKTRSFSFLSNGRKSSSSSLKGLKLMRSTPSFPLHLGHLGNGRTVTADSFEEDLDALQKKRELEQRGKLPDLRVRVDVEKSVYAEERWRGAIHTLLYSHLPRTTTGVTGHIEVV
ncbi:hypothetical protein CVT24_004275 [Panaeolus cyanescens]|uniref:Uncharacterized protein n=1 Tax=Panaeolus cyanescens TaxID=181874 RepID=A0A409VA97_9AGAR|nr:hypothetical protein CVT24_004275 [Panaeolus cyanescens]